MSNSIKNSNFMRFELTVKAKETRTIDFLDVEPNYYRVNNHGENDIFVGLAHAPTEKQYDFRCKKQGCKMYAEPFGRREMHLYNPSSNDVNVVVLAFAHEFDPVTLAMSELEFDFSEVDMDMVATIGEFRTSLPEGDHKIGAVDVEKVPETLMNCLNSIEAFCDQIDRWLNGINVATESITNRMDNPVKDYFDAYSVDGMFVGDEHRIANAGVANIHKIFADTDIGIRFYYDDGSKIDMYLKQGETMENINFRGDGVGVFSRDDAGAFRALVSYA